VATVYTQTHPSGTRVDRVGLSDPAGGSRVAVRLADEDQLADIAAAAGVSVEQVRRIVHDFARPIAAEVEREARSRLDVRVATLGDDGYKRRNRYKALPLLVSVDAWIAGKKRRGGTPKHLADCRAALTAAAAACGWAVLGDLSRDGAEDYLAGLRADGKAPRTCQRVRNVLVDFGKWAAADGRVRVSAFAGLPSVVVRESERTFTRRALTEAELETLLAWLDSGQAGGVGGMGAAARAACYALVADLGLRRGEAAGVVARDFDLGRGVLRLRPELCKTRRGAELPLRAVVVERLRPIVAAAGDGPVFPLPATTAAMVRADLAGARAWWLACAVADRAEREESDTLRSPDRFGGVVDFHALRATAAVRLARAGVDPGIAMRLLRHASYSTTAVHYTRAGAADLVDAVNRLGGGGRDE
jgi:integrase